MSESWVVLNLSFSHISHFYFYLCGYNFQEVYQCLIVMNIFILCWRWCTLQGYDLHTNIAFNKFIPYVCDGTVTIHYLAKVIKYIDISCLHPIHERMIAYLLWCMQVLWLVVTFIVHFVIKILEKPISPFSFSLEPTKKSSYHISYLLCNNQFLFIATSFYVQLHVNLIQCMSNQLVGLIS